MAESDAIAELKPDAQGEDTCVLTTIPVIKSSCIQSDKCT